MLHTTPRLRFCTRAGISLAMGMALLAGCAQAPQPPGYYDTPHDSTLADAQKHAQGGRGTRAPSQVQIGFGETETERARRLAEQAAPDTDTQQAESVTQTDGSQAPAAPSRDVRALREAKTFLGTVPCVHADADCPPMRMTLTLAPSGEWRARTVPVNATSDDSTIVQQGCWDVMGTSPLRIILQAEQQEATISLSFVHDNMLRIMMYNDIRPILDYHLTRQADIDPIDELADRPALSCD